MAGLYHAASCGELDPKIIKSENQHSFKWFKNDFTKKAQRLSRWAFKLLSS